MWTAESLLKENAVLEFQAVLCVAIESKEKEWFAQKARLKEMVYIKVIMCN